MRGATGEVLQPVGVHLLPLSGLPPHKILPQPAALLRELFRAGVTNVPSRPGNSGKRKTNSPVQNLVNCPPAVKLGQDARAWLPVNKVLADFTHRDLTISAGFSRMIHSRNVKVDIKY